MLLRMCHGISVNLALCACFFSRYVLFYFVNVRNATVRSRCHYQNTALSPSRPPDFLFTSLKKTNFWQNVKSEKKKKNEEFFIFDDFPIFFFIWIFLLTLMSILTNLFCFHLGSHTHTNTQKRESYVGSRITHFLHGVWKSFRLDFPPARANMRRMPQYIPVLRFQSIEGRYTYRSGCVPIELEVEKVFGEDKFEPGRGGGRSHDQGEVSPVW